MHYVFRGKDVDKFKFCPLCGGEVLEVYTGDYEGHTTCSDCDEDLSFLILEEMLVRYPKWIEKIKG